MPVIAAVNGFCLGGGIGLVGNADIIVAADDATFGLPEVDRGALGAATHLARLVPQHKMRAMVYTSATATAAELHAFGSVLEVVDPAQLRDAALGVAAQIAEKSPTVIRAAKESLNGIDPVDVKRSYRFEQGFTFELNLSGGQRRGPRRLRREARCGVRRMSIPDKRTTEDEVVAELRDGMTIGIGGWGSRRKPMSFVRAILRSPLTDLTVVSYGGPDVGLLCAAGKVRKAVYGFVSLDSIPLEPHFRLARQSGAVEAMELDEGMLLLGLQAAAWRVPFLPTRAGLGSDLLRVMPEIRTVASPYPGPDGSEPEELVAMPALELDVALIHMNRADQGGNGQFLGPDLYMDDLMAMAATRTFLSAERIVATEDFARYGSFHTQRISRLMVDGVVEAPGGAHFTECPPDYGRDEAFQKEYAATAVVARAVGRVQDPLARPRVGGRLPGRGAGPHRWRCRRVERATSEPREHRRCAAARRSSGWGVSRIGGAERAGGEASKSCARSAWWRWPSASAATARSCATPSAPSPWSAGGWPVRPSSPPWS